MTPFSAIITPHSVSFTTPDGKVHNVEQDHLNWDAILEKIKELKGVTSDDNTFLEKFGLTFQPESERIEQLHQELAELVDVSYQITKAGAGRVVVRGGVVYYEDEPVNMLVTERILWGLGEGFDMTAYMLFLDNAMDNPSKRAVDEMYSFMEKNRMGITEDGYILGYKRVREDFKDIYTGTMDNSPGQIVEMKRNKVNDNPNETCSAGLHFCAMSYLPHYGSAPANKVVIVKVSPADIVSVPIDYDNAKVRCCRYEVLSEYTGSDLEDILKTSPVWSSDDFDYNDDDDDTSFDDDACDLCGEEYDLCECDLVTEDEVDESAVEATVAAAEEFPEHEFDGTDFEDELPPGYFSENGIDMRHIMDSVAANSPEPVVIDRPTLPDAEQMREILNAMDAALVAEAARSVGLASPWPSAAVPYNKPADVPAPVETAPIVEEVSARVDPEVIAEATPEGLVSAGTQEAVRRAFNELLAQVEAFKGSVAPTPAETSNDKDDGEK